MQPNAPINAQALLQAASQNPKLLANLRRQLQADKGRRKLQNFVKMAWPWIEPRELSWNWHIDIVCEHLEAVTRGEISRLLINLPPRTMKSKLSSVIWPIWSWIQNDMIGEDGIKIPTCGAGTKYLCFSYDGRLGLDLSLDCRAIALRVAVREAPLRQLGGRLSHHVVGQGCRHGFRW
jgi:hypothetical protein